jgi:endonuclease G
MSDTFFMTNMSPQRPQFNRGLWLSIERRVRSMVLRYGEAYVITAGVLQTGLPTLSTGISVPDLFFKVLYFPQAELMQAFLVENKKVARSADESDYLVPVDEVETLTGLDFFKDVPETIQAHLESEVVL